MSEPVTLNELWFELTRLWRHLDVQQREHVVMFSWLLARVRDVDSPVARALFAKMERRRRGGAPSSQNEERTGQV